MVVALREVGLYEDWSSNWSVCVGFLSIVVFSLLLSRVTKQSRKGILPFSSIFLVNCLSAFCFFKVFVN